MNFVKLYLDAKSANDYVHASLTDEEKEVTYLTLLVTNVIKGDRVVIGEEIVEKYGSDKLKEVAKLNFANTNRILKTVIF